MERNRLETPDTLVERPSVQTRLQAHLAICRIDHWTKNVFILPGILLPISFLRPDLDSALFSNIAVGTLSACLIASSNYVVNEILDAPFDRLHPTKRMRPAARGLVHIPLGYVQWILIMLAGLALASLVSTPFLITMAVLWLMGCLYNIPPIRTKDLPYLDVLSESVNNPLRMLAGWYMVTTALVPPASLLLSYWMVGCYFMALKRFSEFREIAEPGRAAAYRKSFSFYTERSLLVSVTFYGAAAMLFFGAFLVRYRIELVLAFPLVALVMAIYFHLAFEPNSAVQNPEYLYRQKGLMLVVTLCSVLMVALTLYDIPAIAQIFSATLPTQSPRP